MKLPFVRILPLILILSLSSIPLQKTQAQASDKRIVGYFISWGMYSLNYFVPDIPADKLTHVNYAFANVSDDGQCALGDPEADINHLMPGDTDTKGQLHGHFNQLKKLKQDHPALKVMIAIGGWSYSKYFSDVASTDATRQKFVQSCIDMFIKGQLPGIDGDEGAGIFDGFDIDWEYPVGGGDPTNSARPEDKQNYTLLMAEFRRQLDQLTSTTGNHYLLSIALAPDVSKITNDMEPLGLNRSIDFFNLMGYDFAGSWNKTTHFGAPLYNSPTDPDYEPGRMYSVDDAVVTLIGMGVPPEHINLGVPFYGHGWTGVPNTANGLYQPVGGLAQGTVDDAANPSGIFTYADLKKAYETSDSGYQKFFDKNTVEAWLYNPDKQIFIAYDDPQAMSMKAAYVNNLHLGGVMFWDLSGDDADHSLLNALYNMLH